MQSKKIKWLVYTVMVGLIPIITRFFAWAITTPGTADMFVSSDFMAFGLMLHISNINELEHLSVDPKWKTVQNGMSIIFITCYGVLLTSSLIGAKVIDNSILLVISVILSAVSFGLSYSIYYYLERLGV
jgi:hypothetical protein